MRTKSSPYAARPGPAQRRPNRWRTRAGPSAPRRSRAARGSQRRCPPSALRGRVSDGQQRQQGAYLVPRNRNAHDHPRRATGASARCATRLPSLDGVLADESVNGWQPEQTSAKKNNTTIAITLQGNCHANQRRNQTTQLPGVAAVEENTDGAAEAVRRAGVRLVRLHDVVEQHGGIQRRLAVRTHDEQFVVATHGGRALRWRLRRAKKESVRTNSPPRALGAARPGRPPALPRACLTCTSTQGGAGSGSAVLAFFFLGVGGLGAGAAGARVGVARELLRARVIMQQDARKRKPAKKRFAPRPERSSSNTSLHALCCRDPSPRFSQIRSKPRASSAWPPPASDMSQLKTAKGLGTLLARRVGF